MLTSHSPKSFWILLRGGVRSNRTLCISVCQHVCVCDTAQLTQRLLIWLPAVCIWPHRRPSSNQELFSVQLYWKAPVTHTHTHSLLWRQPTPLNRGRHKGWASTQRKNGSNSTDRKTSRSGTERRNWCQLWDHPPTPTICSVHTVLEKGRGKNKRNRKYWTLVGIAGVAVTECCLGCWQGYQFVLSMLWPLCALAYTITTAATVWLCRHWVTPHLSYAFKLDSLIQAAGDGYVWFFISPS